MGVGRTKEHAEPHQAFPEGWHDYLNNGDESPETEARANAYEEPRRLLPLKQLKSLEELMDDVKKSLPKEK